MRRKQQARIRRFNNIAKHYPASLEAMVRDKFACVDCHSKAIDKLLVHHENQNRSDNELSNVEGITGYHNPTITTHAGAGIISRLDNDSIL